MDQFGEQMVVQQVGQSGRNLPPQPASPNAESIQASRLLTAEDAPNKWSTIREPTGPLRINRQLLATAESGFGKFPIIGP